MTKFSDLGSTAIKSFSRFSRLVKIPVCQVPVLTKLFIYNLRLYKFLGRFSRLVQIQYCHGYMFRPCMTEFSD